MRRLAFVLGSVFLAMTQAKAELIINGQSISSSPSSFNTTSAVQNDFQQCLTNLRAQAIASGVTGLTYDRYTQNLTPDYSVIEKLNYQPEFSTPIWDYLCLSTI